MDSIIKSQKNETNRICSLPNHVIHHILSFLPMRELAQLGLASKCLRELCISIPFLTFDGMQYGKSYLKRLQLINFIDRLIALREGMETQRISIRWPFETTTSEEEYRILTWLHNAKGCRVESLDLEFKLNEKRVFNMPTYVLRCESLMDLKMNLHGGSLRFSSPNGFSRLQSLYLREVNILDEFFGEWVSSFFKHLKRLCLEEIRGTRTITIKSSTLKDLIIKKWFPGEDLCNITVSAETLQNLLLCWEFDSSSGKTLEVFAPNLVRLCWTGYLIDSYCFGEMKYLQAPGIGLQPHPFLGRNRVSNNQDLSQLLHTISSVTVRSLILDDECIKVLYKQGCLLMSMFNNVHSLLIYTKSLNDDLVPALACLLKGTQKLRKLDIRGNKMLTKSLPSASYGFSGVYWESQNLMLLDHLKVAEIELTQNGDNDLELIKYLLKHAKCLEKMIITHSPLLFPSDISRLINNYEKASAVKVVYHPKP